MNSSSRLDAKCEPGLILPVWEPQEDLGTGDTVLRGSVYFVAMLYIFIGVSIISDRFMGAIEVITAKEKQIKIKRKSGEHQTIVVRVWNETVANLTLMALGSSAPEILLSIIEIVGKDFEAGALGPGTIVGSAAFNFLVIIGICVLCIPSGEVRRIKHLRVFFVTAIWSLFAYIWLLVILKLSSPGIVEVWEGMVTFLFFFATVGSAYAADRRLLDIKKLTKSYRLNKRGVIVEAEGNTELGMLQDGQTIEAEDMDAYVREFEQHRQEYVELLRELRRRHPDTDLESLEALAKEEILSKAPKSRAFYRIQATRKLISGQSLLRRLREKAALESMYTLVAGAEESNPNLTRIFFSPSQYTVMESCGSVEVSVVRQGGDLSQVVLVDYETEDGTANYGTDYIRTKGTLTFEANETTKKINVEVLDDDVFEEDEHFYVKLSNPRVHHIQNGGAHGPTRFELEIINPARITVLDDDHSGVYNFAEKDMETVESTGTLQVKVVRASGARGKVRVPYTTVAATAKPGTDYEHVEGYLIFENNETEQNVAVPILEENTYEKDVFFYVELGEPVPLDEKNNPLPKPQHKMEMSKEESFELAGWPRLGSDYHRVQIRITESKEFKNTVDKLLEKTNTSLLVGTSSWKEQFVDAVTVNAGGDEDGEEKKPSCGDYVVHALTVFWKVIFAFIPPTNIWGGYLTFFVSILGIGILTAFIGDLASHLGCTVGLRDYVTAIIFVALGTSVPDTFASKQAAVQDKYADASIGNVTGSNAVNVFLGIGIAWTIAAIVHAFKNCAPEDPNCGVFRVDPGSLAFSVSLFCSCAIIVVLVMMLRRLSVFGGGELGGPAKYKFPTAILFFALWVFYVVVSSMETYELIEGF